MWETFIVQNLSSTVWAFCKDRDLVEVNQVSAVPVWSIKAISGTQMEPETRLLDLKMKHTREENRI